MPKITNLTTILSATHSTSFPNKLNSLSQSSGHAQDHYPPSGIKRSELHSCLLSTQELSLLPYMIISTRINSDFGQVAYDLNGTNAFLAISFCKWGWFWCFYSRWLTTILSATHSTSFPNKLGPKWGAWVWINLGWGSDWPVCFLTKLIQSQGVAWANQVVMPKITNHHLE